MTVTDNTCLKALVAEPVHVSVD